MAVIPPTPEETKWASFVMNEQRHKRPVSPEDRERAGQIMQRARHASGKLGGGSKKKASPLVVAAAIKDIDAKVAEAQGINASREGEAVPPPVAYGSEARRQQLRADEQAWGVPEAEAAEQAVPVPPADPERAYRDASGRLLDQIQGDMERYRKSRDAAAQIVRDHDIRLDILQRRHDAVLDGLRALDEGRHDA